jgi:hypothetical protein
MHCSNRVSLTFDTGHISWTDCRFSGNTAGDSNVPESSNGGAIYTTASGGGHKSRPRTYSSKLTRLYLVLSHCLCFQSVKLRHLILSCNHTTPQPDPAFRCLSAFQQDYVHIQHRRVPRRSWSGRGDSQLWLEHHVHRLRV